MFTIALTKYNKTKFWSREMGKEIREAILAEYLPTNEKILNIDFNDTILIDYSFASEVIGVIILRLSFELLGHHLIISNMNAHVEENVAIALDKAEVCALSLDRGGKWKLVGRCSEALFSTFEAIMELKSIDTPTLSERLGVNTSAVNNRLKTLVSLGLIKKTEGTAPSGGKQFIYSSII